MSGGVDASFHNIVRTADDGQEDPPDYFHSRLSTDTALAQLDHEARRRAEDGGAADTATLQKRLKDQIQLVQDLTCQVNRLEREMDDQREVLDKISDIEMANETLETKFRIQSETIKTQQVRVNEALRDKELAQKQSVEDAALIDELRKKLSALSLCYEEVSAQLRNKTKECDHAHESYETLDQHASHLRAANAALSERVQVLEELVDKYENEDLSAFFTRRGAADNATAKAALKANDKNGSTTTASATAGNVVPQPPPTTAKFAKKVVGGEAVLRGGGGGVSPSPTDDFNYSPQHVTTAHQPVVKVPTPMYATDGHGTPIIPRPLPPTATSTASLSAAFGGVGGVASSLSSHHSAILTSSARGGNHQHHHQQQQNVPLGAASAALGSRNPYSISPNRGASPRVVQTHSYSHNDRSSVVSATRYGGGGGAKRTAATAGGFAGGASSAADVGGTSTPPRARTVEGVHRAIGGGGGTFAVSSSIESEGISFNGNFLPRDTSAVFGVGTPATAATTATEWVSDGAFLSPNRDLHGSPVLPTASSTPERNPVYNGSGGGEGGSAAKKAEGGGGGDGDGGLAAAEAVLEGRGVFQTLRAKRMEMQEKEAKLREQVLKAGGTASGESGDDAKKAFGTASVD